MTGPPLRLGTRRSPGTRLAKTTSGEVDAVAAGTDELRLDAIVVAADGGAALRGSISGPAAAATRLGRKVAADLLARGADRYTSVSAGHLSYGEDAK